MAIARSVVQTSYGAQSEYGHVRRDYSDTLLAAFRQDRLGRLGGYGVPSVDQASANFWKGIDGALLLWPTRTPWQAVACTITIAVVTLALISWRRSLDRVLLTAACGLLVLLSLVVPSLFLQISHPLVTWQGIASGVVISAAFLGLGVAIARGTRRALFLMATGFAATLGFNLPFVLVSKREQYHLLALGAVFLLAGVCDAFETAAPKKFRYVAVVAILATVPLAALARTQAAFFLPCAAPVLQTDEDASNWWVVPVEIKQYLAEKKRRCSDGRPPSSLTELPIVSWDVYDERPGDGEPYRWTSDHAVLLVQRNTQVLGLAVRRPGASVAMPVSVQFQSGGHTTTVLLDSSDWKYVTVQLVPDLLGILRAARRIDIRVMPWFVPAVLDPKSSDLRRFGVQFRVVELRGRGASGKHQAGGTPATRPKRLSGELSGDADYS